MPEKRPNILIFMTDQQNGATVLPEHPCKTPNLDRFAQESVTFTQLHCPTAHCCPSRASLMTGLYPSRHGVFNNVDTTTAIHGGLNPGLTLWSEELRGAGYQMAYSGKWHVSHEEGPEERGWQNLNGPFPKGKPDARLQPQMWQSAKQQLAAPEARQRGCVLRPGWGNVRLYGEMAPKGDDRYAGHGDTRIVARGLEALKGLAAGEDPWCLYLGVNGPHDCYVIPEYFARMYDPAQVELPPSFRDDLLDKPRIYQRMRYQHWAQLSDDEIREAIAHYWGYCTMEDMLFGEVLQALEATGQADNTVVLYMSDHGDYCGAHGLWAKGVPAFSEAYHVPLMVRWPGRIAEPGSRVDEFISMTDFRPSFLELAGAQARSEPSGQSFVPFLRGERPANWRDAWFTQFNGVELYYSQRTVTTKNWRYVYNGFDFDEMYDLQQDPQMMRNLVFPDLGARPASTHTQGLAGPEGVPWPPLSPELEAVRRDLLTRLWGFAREQEDIIFNPYLTVAQAPLGPGLVM